MRAFLPVSILAMVLTSACGGGSPAPANPEPQPPAASSHDTPAPPASASAAAAHTAPAPEAKKPDYHDPNESETPIRLEPLLAKNTPKAKFPKATIGDRECWQNTAIVGDHQKDYDTVLGKCGAATGLLEYVKPVKGRLHHIHDKRDTYVLKVHGGMCYRYFAIADGTMTDMDILVTKPNGALVADDKTKSPVAIIHNDNPWCMDDDEELHFHVEVDGPGEGHYLFAVWARPKKLGRDVARGVGLAGHERWLGFGRQIEKREDDRPT